MPLCPVSFFSFPLTILLFCPHTFALHVIVPFCSGHRLPIVARPSALEELTVPPVFSTLFSRTPDVFIFSPFCFFSSSGLGSIKFTPSSPALGDPVNE